MVPHSSTLAWHILWTEEPGRLQSMGSLRVGHNWVTSLSLFTFVHWRRKWQPTPVSCLENPVDRRAWWAAVYGVAQSRTRLKWLSSSSSSSSFVFLIYSLKLALSLSSFTLIKRLFSSSSLSAIRVVSSAYLRLLMFLPPILIPACNSASPEFLMMCLEYRLNKQGDSGQPCHTPFLILNQSVVPYRVLTVASWPTYRFLRRQGRWSGIAVPPRAFHSLSSSTQSKALV